ncbi:MAG TPA: BolA/IbaG family iron-sulfur metabolism protein [Rhodanobacteraceae bacterium]
MKTQAIKTAIEQAVPDATVEVRSDDEVHFEARVVSDAFAGKLPLARHRMVYAALGDDMGNAIHALSLKTLTREEAARTSRG